MSSPEESEAQRPSDQPQSALADLLALQDEDLAADQLAHRRAHLPERAHLASLDGQRDAVSSAKERIEQQRSTHAVHQETLEKAIAETSERIVAIETKLRAGGASSYRDQGAMAAEVESSSRHRSQLEDEELAVMEVLEPLDTELARLQAALATIEAESAVAHAALAEKEVELDIELERVAAQRAPIVLRVPEDLRADYERLRSHLGGVGAARLLNGICSGCHLKLPATELDRIRRAVPTTVFHCDQCGRILVP